MQLELVRHDKCLHLTPRFEHIFRHTFYICNRELNRLNHPGIVRVDFIPMPIKGVAGGTHPQKTNPYEVTLDVDGSLDMIFSFSHEMVHVDQLLRGDLKFRPDNSLYGGDLLWKGRPVFLDKAARMNGKSVGRHDRETSEPHEVEAYREGPKIYNKVIESLSADDLQFCCKTIRRFEADPENVFSNLQTIRRLAQEKQKLQAIHGRAA